MTATATKAPAKKSGKKNPVKDPTKKASAPEKAAAKPAAPVNKTTATGEKNGEWDPGRETRKIDIRQITSSYNHRNPLSKPFQEAGYGMFEPEPGSDKPALFGLATSEDPALRQQFVELMETFDKADDDSGGIIDLALNMLSVGQLEEVGVRDNGKKDGKPTYQLVYGHRRCLAVLYLWCKRLVRTNEPRIIAQKHKGNHQQLQVVSISENLHRKGLTIVEQARAWQVAVNGGESVEELANRFGMSPQTVESRISLLELPPDTLKKVESGQLKYVNALEIVRDLRQGGEGKTKDGLTAEEAADRYSGPNGTRGTKRKMRSRTEVEKRWAEAADSKERNLLAWVLKMDEGDDVAEVPAEFKFSGEISPADEDLTKPGI